MLTTLGGEVTGSGKNGTGSSSEAHGDHGSITSLGQTGILIAGSDRLLLVLRCLSSLRPLSIKDHIAIHRSREVIGLFKGLINKPALELKAFALGVSRSSNSLSLFNLDNGILGPGETIPEGNLENLGLRGHPS